MTRFSLLLALALGLGACDSSAPSTSADVSATRTSMASAKSDGIHRITESVSVFVEGDHVLLDIKGQTVALGAGEAYLIGQTLARIGFETLSPEMAEVFPPAPVRPGGGGGKCEPPLPRSAVQLIGTTFFGECPPPPPPGLFYDARFRAELLGSAPVEIVEAPEGLDWQSIPGGFSAHR